MTDGMAGVIKALSEKKRRYLRFVNEYIAESKPIISKMDKRDPDYEYFMALLDDVKGGIKDASDAIDEMIGMLEEER